MGADRDGCRAYSNRNDLVLDSAPMNKLGERGRSRLRSPTR